MNTIFVHRDGRTEQVTSIDRSWLSPGAGTKAAYIWVDLNQPSIPESLVLSDTFAFHRLSIDDALLTSQTPRIEAYDGYLFAGIAGALVRLRSNSHATRCGTHKGLNCGGSTLPGGRQL